MNIPESRKPLISTFMERNSKINLSAIRNPEDIYTKHILDALEIQHCPARQELVHKNSPLLLGEGSGVRVKKLQVCDLGTGGGFPLLPLATQRPMWRYTGLDARKKKLSAINEMITELGMTNAKTFWCRAEEHTIRYDVVTARGVAHAEILLPRVEHLLKKSGTAFLYKMWSMDEDAYIVERCLDHDRDYHRYKYTSYDGQERIIYSIGRN